MVLGLSAPRSESVGGAALTAIFVLCLFAYIPATPSEPELFTLPKEGILCLGSLLAVGIVFFDRPQEFDWIDLTLVVYLVVSVVSILAARTYYTNWRALGTVASGVVLFWMARTVGSQFIAGRLTKAAAAFCGMMVLQSYGWFPDFSLGGRAPGATVGNRNEAARLAVLFAPIVWRHAMHAETRCRYIAGAAILGLLAMSVTLSRSRTAWVAGGVLLLALSSMLLFRRMLPRHCERTRVAIFVVIVVIGLVVYVPSKLRWNALNPYSATLRSIVDVTSGSGRGRLLQYRNTLRMVGDHPALGVGPGNWMVRYGEYASFADPSYRQASLFPTDRLPQSDWLAVLAEGGIVAFLSLLASPLLLLIGGFRRLTTCGCIPSIDSLALGGVTCAWLIMGLGDPVVLLPSCAALVAISLGMLLPRRVYRSSGVSSVLYRVMPPVRIAACLGAVVVISLSAFAVSARLRSTLVLRTALSRDDFERAVSIDPSDYSARIAAARISIETGDCARAAEHLNHASKLVPNALPHRLLVTQCRGFAVASPL